MKNENTSRRSADSRPHSVDDETYPKVLARIRLILSLLKGDVGRLRNDIKRLEENLSSLIELMNKIEGTS